MPAMSLFAIAWIEFLFFTNLNATLICHMPANRIAIFRAKSGILYLI